MVQWEVDRLKLALVIEVTDSVTGRPPTGGFSIELVDRPEGIVRTRSGYYVVTDLPDEITAVTVAVEPNGPYLPETCECDVVDLEEDDTEEMVSDIELLPAPAYRFPSHSTLVRGSTRVAEGEETPRIGDVVLEVLDDDEVVAETRSSPDGEFILPFVNVEPYLDDRGDSSSDTPGNGPPNDNASTDEDMFVTIGSADPTILASKPNTDLEAAYTVVIKEGQTIVADIVLEPNSS